MVIAMCIKQLKNYFPLRYVHEELFGNRILSVAALCFVTFCPDVANILTMGKFEISLVTPK